MSSTSGFAFSQAGFDRAAHLRADAEALDARWPQARVLRIDGDGDARGDGDPSTWPRGESLASVRPAAALWLGEHGGDGFFALTTAGSDLPAVGLRHAGMHWPALPAALFVTAAAVLGWQRRHRFCAGCGDRLQHRHTGWVAQCSGCGQESYPRTDPAMIVAVTRGDALLLGRQASWPENRWSVLAGFLEPGESLEDCVRREVWEESRIAVRAVRYAGSQPWPFPQALMVGFFAEAEPDAGEPQAADELEQARFFPRAEVQAALDGLPGAIGLSPRLSISRWLIEQWAAGPDAALQG